MWETRSWRFPRKREIPRSWFLGDFPLPSFPPLAWIYETLLAGFDHPAGYFDSPTNSATEPYFKKPLLCLLLALMYAQYLLASDVRQSKAGSKKNTAAGTS